jgi:hypothetical protein
MASMSVNRYVHENQAAWEEYRDRDLSLAKPVLEALGVTLQAEQVHIGGERYLMTGYKLVLVGTMKGAKAVIKVSSHTDGKHEISEERRIATILQNLPFSYRPILLPNELAYTETDGVLVRVVAWIEQDKHFLAYPIKDQFFLALRAFDVQESTHATAASHARSVARAIATMRSREYQQALAEHRMNCMKFRPDDTRLHGALLRAEEFMNAARVTVDRYGGFLTHNDFVPHNFRIVEGRIYLLDHTSLLFGSKYESWARFLNFMTHHNLELDKLLGNYVRENRGEDEYLCLRVMRAYNCAILLDYYTGAAHRTEGDLRELTEVRIAFFTTLLEHVLEDKEFPGSELYAFVRARDRLRSPEEKARQKVILGG